MAQFQLLFKPQPLGKLAPTSGTPIRATANLSNAYGNTQSSLDLWANKLEFVAPITNAGNVFILYKGDNTTTDYSGVIRVLSAGQSWSIGDYSRGSGYWVGTFLVDVDTTGDFCYGSADVAP